MPVFRLTAPWKPRTRKQIGARKAQRVGRNFQDAILASATFHHEIVKLEELPAFGAKRIAGGKIIPTKICCDFVGAFAGGTGLFFDAKSIHENAASFPSNNPEVCKPHQVSFLRRMSAMGACAGFLIECKKLGRYLWLPIGQLDTLLPMRFSHDGSVWPQFVDLGPIIGMVDFAALRRWTVVRRREAAL